MSRKQRFKKHELKIEVPRPKERRAEIKGWVFFLITATVLLVYADSLNNGFVSDDVAAILENPNRTNLGASLASSPLSFVFTTIRYLTGLVAGTNPLPYRLVNLLFHAGSANLLFLILSGMVGFVPAVAIALIFAVHPLLSEAVIWISAAQYSMGTFFCLLTIYFYLQSPSLKSDWKGWLSYLAALSCLQFSLALAPILVIYELLKANLHKTWMRLAVFCSLATGFLVLSLAGHLLTRVMVYGAIRNPASGKPDLFLQAPVAIANYLSLFLWPDKLTLYHSEMSFTVMQIVWYFVISLLVVSLAVWGWFKDRRITFWVMWFLLGISITLTPWGVTWIVAERYTYFGLIGLIVVSVLMYERLIGKRIPKGVNIAILVILLLALGTRTIIRNRDWKDLDTLALATESVSPTSEHNHNNLGEYYTKRREWDKAIEEFEKAIEINPRFAPAYNNLGNAYLYNNKLDEAEKNFKTAISISSELWQSYAQLAVISSRRGDWRGAETILRKGIGIHSNSELWRGLGVVYLHENNKEKAIEAFTESLRLDPQNEAAKEGLNKANK